MSTLIASTENILIVGLGVTGLSVARYLSKQGKPFTVADERLQPPMLSQLQADMPGARLLLGPFQFADWAHFSRIVLSPGVPRSHPAIVQAIAAGIAVVGDIELFLLEARAPVVGITGSNGKTTVTTLVGAMAEASGLQVKVGGNIGTPALDLLDDSCQLYVLELSSFQLESIGKLNAQVACILNISADHMDRYPNLQSYVMAKQRIAFGAKRMVVNRADVLTQPPLPDSVPVTKFGLGAPDLKDYGALTQSGDVWIARGLRPLLPAKELKIRGSHNILNALAALAIAEAAGIAEAAALDALRSFTGLPHRCQWVANVEGVDFVNDSKATNVGAVSAALQGLAAPDSAIILIAGGDGKGADFSQLGNVIADHVNTLITIGADGPAIARACEGRLPVQHCSSLSKAVQAAFLAATPGDLVLLSPACASFDMFKNYEDRGEQFIHAVEALQSC